MKPKKPKSKENRLSEDEIRSIGDACKSEEDTFCVLGLLYTGMRVSEFIHMTRDWVNFDKEVIIIPERQPCDCYECKNRDSVWKPKTKAGARVIPLLPEIKSVFRSVFSEYDSAMEYLLNRVHAWKVVKRVATRAKINHNVFCHCLRSTFASILAEKGFDVFTITTVLGWSKLAIAESYVRMSGSAVVDKFKEKW